MQEMYRQINTTSIDLYKCRIGRQIKNFYTCVDKKNKKTKTGDKYIDIRLKNSRGVINAKLWNNVDYFSQKFKLNDTVAVKGVCDEYNGEKLIRILSINKISDDRYNLYSYNINNLFDKSTPNVKIEFSTVDNYIELVENDCLDLIRIIYKDNYNKFSNIPLTFYREYSKESGYIDHLCNILRIADSYQDSNVISYTSLITCILIHDIGKVDYFNFDDIPMVSSEGLLFGSSNLGVKLIERYGKKLNADKSVVDKLCHIILSYEKISNYVENSDIGITTKEVNLLYRLKENDFESYRK